MENERNVEQRPEYSCLHKLDNKCSSSRVFLSDTRLGVERRGGAAPVPCVHLLMPQAEHLLHGRDPGAGEALAVLAHSDGLQPFGHRPEHGAVAAAGAGQPDGDSEEQKSSLVSVLLSCLRHTPAVSHSCDFRTVGQSRRWFLMIPDFVAVCPKS